MFFKQSGAAKTFLVCFDLFDWIVMACFQASFRVYWQYLNWTPSQVQGRVWQAPFHRGAMTQESIRLGHTDGLARIEPTSVVAKEHDCFSWFARTKARSEFLFQQNCMFASDQFCVG